MKQKNIMSEGKDLARSLEIMAPAGNFECLQAAIQGGADSVYFGVEKLNMRSHSANNFKMTDLAEIVRICSEHGVKTYLTLNIVLYNEDIEDMKRTLEAAKAAFQMDSQLQNKMNEYEAERMLLGQEFSKDPSEADQRAIADLRARIEQLSSEIGSDPKYIAFSEAQRAMNELMADVNAEIKYCITGERPAECTHDCSTCKGCH